MASTKTTFPGIASQSSRIYDPWDLMTDANESDRKIHQAQTTIYDIFIDLVKTWKAADVLSLFRQVFIHNVDSSETNLSPALYTILTIGREDHFHYTLNRTCYILINNWEPTREYDAIIELLNILTTSTTLDSGQSPHLRQLREWLKGFAASQAFEDLKLYITRFSQSSHWTHRYTPYLLASQCSDAENPQEQRHIAKVVSQSLKQSFKRDLAMYTVQCDRYTPADQSLDNPTLLGRHIFPLIKKTLIKQGQFNGQDVANIFISQSKTLNYKRYKESLKDYLVFSVADTPVTHTLKHYLSERLDTLYPHYEQQQVNDSIQLRTANQVIECLVTDKKGVPSPTMTALLGQGYTLTLAMLLLKVIMISPKSRAYLEARMGDLIRYHASCAEEDCRWLLYFLEVLRVLLTIYTDPEVKYDLVSVSDQPSGKRPSLNSKIDLDAYRIFAQWHRPSRRQEIDGATHTS